MRDKHPDYNVGDRVQYKPKYKPTNREREGRMGTVVKVRYIIKDAEYRAVFRPDGEPRDTWVKANYLRKVEEL